MHQRIKQDHMIRYIKALCLLWALLPSVAAAGGAGNLARQHMVAAANGYATEAGLEILRAGGSAADAAIAVQLVLGLVEPQSSGIGGGAFMVYYAPASGGRARVLTTYDGRETAPAAVTPDLFAAIPRSREGYFDAVAGGRSVGTPGAVAMFALAHRQQGRLPWGDLFAPAIRLAAEGFVVSPRLQLLAETDPLLRQFPAARDYLFTADGKPHAVGTRLKNPAYAAVLKRIRDQGPAAFYDGGLAAAMVDAVQNAPRNPGALSLADLQAYQALERPPVCGEYRVYTICGAPPPSSGGTTVLAILKLLEPFDLGAPSGSGVGGWTPRTAHLFVEAARLAYADRDAYVADPAFVPVPTAGLVDAEYLHTRARMMTEDSRMAATAPGLPPGADARGRAADATMPSTSSYAVVDRWGAVASVTTTVESAFGSRIWVEGFFLNNQLTDFAFQPVDADGLPVANRVEPGKRPRSAMSPSIVFTPDGNFKLAVGSPGGPSIITFVTKTLIGTLDWGMTMDDAIELPNIVATSDRGVTLEDDALANALEAKGHSVTVRRIASGLQGIMAVRDDTGKLDHYDGGADSRREGVALGD